MEHNGRELLIGLECCQYVNHKKCTIYIIGELSMFWSGITCDGCGQQLAYANIMPKNRLIVLARQGGIQNAGIKERR